VRCPRRIDARLREHVGRQIGKLARPSRIIWADDLPKTRSGKIMRRLLRDIAEDPARRRYHPA
jgi:acetyl-CoA synthetase